MCVVRRARRGIAMFAAAARVAFIGTVGAVALSLSACAATVNGSPHVSGAAVTSAASSTTPSTGKPSSTASPATTQNCSLPLTHATGDGFHIGVPTGWDLSTLNGQVVVGSSPADSEAVLVYPARLTNGLSAPGFFTRYLSALDRENASAGSPVTVQQATGANGLPAVTFTQTVGGTQLPRGRDGRGAAARGAGLVAGGCVRLVLGAGLGLQQCRAGELARSRHASDPNLPALHGSSRTRCSPTRFPSVGRRSTRTPTASTCTVPTGRT